MMKKNDLMQNLKAIEYFKFNISELHKYDWFADPCNFQVNFFTILDEDYILSLSINLMKTHNIPAYIPR